MTDVEEDQVDEGVCTHSGKSERANLEPALVRGLLAEEDRLQPWRVIESCYAAQLSDAALERLIREGVIKREQRAEAAAILRGISRRLEQANG